MEKFIFEKTYLAYATLPEIIKNMSANLLFAINLNNFFSQNMLTKKDLIYCLIRLSTVSAGSKRFDILFVGLGRLVN